MHSVCMASDQRLTIPEIAKLTEKSETTIRRHLPKINTRFPNAVTKKDSGNYFTYLIDESAVREYFGIEDETKPNKQVKTGYKVPNISGIPEGYILVHQDTLRQTKEQIDEIRRNAERIAEEMLEKNQQIKELMKTNTSITGFIADLGKQNLLSADNDDIEAYRGSKDDARGDLSDVSGVSGTSVPRSKKQTQTKSKKQVIQKRKKGKKSDKKQTPNAKKTQAPKKKKGFFERLFS